MNTPQPIIILMPVRNGADFLAAQIESLLEQVTRPDLLLVSDDGSTDESVPLIASATGSAKLSTRIIEGPQLGYAANIAQLIRIAPRGYWAFCDQDDVWLHDRLTRGMAALRSIPGPALHVVGRVSTDADLRPKRRLPAPKRASFRRALMRNDAPANATLLNPAAVDLVRRALPDRHALPSFPDWWIYALVLGAGGRVIFDPKPGLFYRQHEHNLFGARGGAGWLRRADWLLNGTHLQRMREVRHALRRSEQELTPDNRRILAWFDCKAKRRARSYDPESRQV